MGRGLRPWGMPGSPHPGTLAAALEFIHTNNCSNPILALLCGRFEARVYSSENRSRIQLKRLPDHGLAPCNISCVVCDLMARGSGGIPGQAGGQWLHPILKGKPRVLVRGVRG
jgi:hypothetical protein